MVQEIKPLKKEVIKAIGNAKILKDLDRIYWKYLGRKGKISLLFDNLKNLPLKDRKMTGKELNEIKEEIKTRIETRRKVLSQKEKVEPVDITLPGETISMGHLHPLTKTLLKCEEIFENMGFSIVEGPEVESEWYNFDALNIPKEHPARDVWDTLWLRPTRNAKPQEKYKLLLRTHTSPVQVHYMEKHNPPLRIIVPGRVFRYEATDPSHEIQFYQLEGLMVDKKISVTNFKGIVQRFLKEFFAEKIQIRIRPGYFPFTEPSFEVDIRELSSDKKRVISGWVELVGAGMVHPNVLKTVRLDPKNWQGFAFGMGIDRLAMVKHKINDIRLFYKGDLRFLEQF